MQGNILSCYPVILPSQVILPPDVTSVSAFHVQGIVYRVPSQLILPSGDVIAVRAVTVVRTRYNKTMVALVRGK